MALETTDAQVRQRMEELAMHGSTRMAVLSSGMHDIGYVQRDRAEMEVLLTFFADRCEIRLGSTQPDADV